MANYKGIGYDELNGRNRTSKSTDTVSFGGGVNIDGNLEVVGNIISRDEERVLVQDNFLDINFGYTTTAAGLEGGIAVNYLAVAGGRDINSTGANITFTAASGGTRPALSVAQAQLPNGTFAANDIIQIAGTTNAENDGFYVVSGLTNADPAVLSIKSTAISSPDTVNAKFAQVNFTAETENQSTSVTITKVNVNVLQTSAAGAWQVADGNVDTAFASFTPLGTSTLQQAYEAGNTIGMTNANGDFDVSNASGTNAVSLDAAAASNFTVAGNSLTLSTTTSGELDLTSAGLMDMNAGANLDIDVTGTFDVLSTGAFSIDGTGASNLTATSGTLTVSTATSGNLILSSVATLDLDGVGVNIDSSGAMDITAADGQTLSLNHGGGSAFAINAGGQIDLTAEAAQAINIGVTQANLSLSTTTSGEIDLTSAGNLDLNGVATTINGTGGVALAGSGAASSFISTAQDLTLEVASGAADGLDLILQSTGGGDSSVLIASAGTGGDAVGISASAGDISIATGSSGGDIEIFTEGAAKMARIVSNFPMFVRTFTADGTGVAAGDCLFTTNSGGTAVVTKCDADGIATTQFIGVAMNAASAGNPVNVMVAGISNGVTGTAAFNAANNLGKKVYLSTDAGKVQLAPPDQTDDVVFQVGICIGGTGTSWQVLLQPQFIMEIG